MKNLERENQLLKGLIVDLATFIKDLFDVMPDDIRTAESSIRMLEIANRLIDTYGSTLPTSDHRQ